MFDRPGYYFSFVILSFTAAMGVLSEFARSEDPTLVAPTGPRSPEEQQKLFRLPPGFEIQLVAAEPEIAKPMNIAFDDRSRLWVTNSIEYPFAAAPDGKPRDSIKILEDTDGDGRADRVQTFVDGLNIPIGVLPVPASKGGGCIAYSIPSIFHFRDADGDDRADSRDVLFTGFGFADTHGMSSSYTWGFDGWIYATHGFANQSEVKGRDGQVLKMHSGNTYRFRADGSRIEQWTWGQVNPFGLAFDSWGNLYSADCHSRPIMMLLRGAYYQSFGKPHDGLGFGPEVCTHEHGSTGIAGIVYYEADQFPTEYHGTIFTGNPVTNRINHDKLERHGSTFQTVHQPDFLTCDDPWFRPVAMTLGPDGALYIADFYNKIIGHYEVPLTHPGRDRERGRIWRVVYTGPEGDRRATGPRRDWTTASLDELIDDLGDANSTVRTIAANQIVHRIGETADGRLRQVSLASASAIQQVHAIWAQQRLGEALLARSDAEPLVRAHFLRASAESELLHPSLAAMIARYLAASDGMVQRAAAESLARHPSPENVRPLLGALLQAPAEDPQRVHALRIALREQLRPDNAFEAVEQMDLSAEEQGAIADVALGVPNAAAANWLLAYLQENPETIKDRDRLLAHVARHLPNEDVASLLSVAHQIKDKELRGVAAMIRVLHEGFQARGGRRSEELQEWGTNVAQALFESRDVEDVREAVRLTRAMKLASLVEPLRQIAAGRAGLQTLRGDAIPTLMEVQGDEAVPFLSSVLGNSIEPPALRQQVAAALGQLQRDEVHAELAKHLRTASEDLAVHIAAALAGGRGGAETLLNEIAAGKATPRLLLHPLVNARLRATQLEQVETRIAQLTEGLPPAEERLQKAITSLRATHAQSQREAVRGAKMFEKHCASCHRIGEVGNKVGPQLDGIGLRGLDRLLEDVLDPNRNVDQAFRSSVIALKTGQVLSGLVVTRDGEVVVLVDGQGKEQRISESDIEESTVSKLSPMPANVSELMSEAELHDLLAFLMAQRQEPPKQ